MNMLSTRKATMLAITDLALCMALVLTSGVAAAPANTPLSTSTYTSPDFVKIDDYVRAQMQANPIPGVALGIAHGDQIVHLQGFGVAGPDGKAVSPQTPFRIASIGKTFTALAVRQLINNGRVEEGAPVQRYIPWFRVADPQASAQITVRHLLHHASGIPGNATAGVEFNERYTTEQMIRTLDKVALDRPVGSSYEYANANFLILGLIIEAVSGQPYTEYVQQNIFAPLGMTHTYLSEETAKQNGLASGHQPWFGVVMPANEPFVTGMLPAGAATISSAEDLARFASLYLTDGRYSRNGSDGGNGSRSIVGTAPAGNDTNYDLYWNPGEGLRSGYSGQEGSTPTVSGGLYLSREQGWAVVVLSNARLEYFGPGEGASGGNIAEGVMQMLRGQTPTPPSDRGFHQAVLTMDLMLLALVVFLGAQLVLLRRWRRPVPQRSRGPVHVLLQFGLPVGVDLILAAAAFFGLPFLNRTPWSYLIGVMPDLSYTLLVAGVILLALAIAKVLLAYIALHQPAPAVPRGRASAPVSTAAPTPPAPPLPPVPPAARSV